MIYLTLAADYLRPSLRLETGGHLDLDAAQLPDDFVATLREWNRAYQTVIPLSQQERQAPEVRDAIERLDEQGRLLAARLADVIEGEAKVKYFSEGQARYLP